MPRIPILIAACAAGLAGLVLLWPGGDAPDGTPRYDTPGMPRLSAAEAEENFWKITPALLMVVYEAFDRTEEAVIYDTLATVTHGAALEYLYLQRVGAMAGGGLPEAEQSVHEIALLDARVDRAGTALRVAATWEVIGTVAHAQHVHIRGNTYSADLTIAPVAGAWRITDFTLRDVSRSGAGAVIDAPPTQ